ncbi:MAG TPA: hypothetical protein VGQ02_09880 [Candidatus Limnocylindrales bacterium]|nr:hypothetical protein [Candidatus Limnocylindrales bacterium]
MRPRWLVVGSVLSAALALVALPGLAGSRVPSAVEPVPAGAFQPYSVPASEARSPLTIAELDHAFLSVGRVIPTTTFVEPGEESRAGPTRRLHLDQPDGSARSERKPEKYTLTGKATFYDHGTTAMRLPRGTVIVVCAKGGCLERVVNDYGPQKPERIIDLYRPDFFKICGCPSWSGVINVTVYVY